MGYGIFGQKITGIRDIKTPLMGPPLYLSRFLFEVLQFSNANRIVSSLRKGTRFWCPEVHFQAQSPCFPGQS